MRFPLISKVGALGAVTLGLIWSLSSVQSVVQERQQRQQEAEHSVANSLAGSQKILGPVVTRLCTETWVAGQTEGANPRPVYEATKRLIRLPASQLNVDGKVSMTPRYRGMFKVNGYTLKSSITAQWADTKALQPSTEHPQGQLSCEAPILSVGLSDARGIRVAELVVNGRNLPVSPGSGVSSSPQGFQAALNDSSWKDGAPMSVSLELELAGTQALAITPVANTTVVKLSADWPHPSFGGRFLPSERVVQAKSFDATWKVTSLASTAQQEWVHGSPLCGNVASNEGAATGCVESFGIDFMDPVNPYVLSDRATKYGLLFIALTFVGVGLVEVLRRLRVHPIQYLLVGAALSVFFLLLVSLSEHMAFAYAYAAASLACTLLLTFYGSFVLQGMRAGLAFGGGIAGLFATLYALLQMEQTALVLGSVLLFLVLAAVMVTTRKLNWYELLGQMRQERV